MLNASMPWPNHPLDSPGVDSWLNQYEGNFYENEPLPSPALVTDQYISPQHLYNSSTPNSSHNNHVFSEASSPGTPSLCDDDPNLISPKQESLHAPSPTRTFPTGPRKRGRPRNIRPASEDLPYDDPAHVSKTSRPKKRQPHNQVERKYREGLNAELERLRMALPTIHKWEMRNPDNCVAPKASKAAVLAGAVAYIQDMERERDHLRRENELLKGGRGFPKRGYE
ncbi:hypothetical protein FKW77_003491 [Venturia effusa]|uniref:BHLH domain-containing protein n=1 Tax=Venturia effusa TaxID=50376 RepID=A0A517LDK4_9PEZI|nr:hypothetical protein FKW77_003491 [Venturia effusa]